LRGALQLTNLAPRRPDNVNCPTLRGLLTTDDGAKAYVEMNGLAHLRASDNARVFATSLTFRTGDAQYAWLNGFLGLTEGVLDAVTVGGVVRIRAYRCDDLEVRQGCDAGDGPRGALGTVFLRLALNSGAGQATWARAGIGLQISCSPPRLAMPPTQCDTRRCTDMQVGSPHGWYLEWEVTA
jgi:hypothetical protein